MTYKIINNSVTERKWRGTVGRAAASPRSPPAKGNSHLIRPRSCETTRRTYNYYRPTIREELDYLLWLHGWRATLGRRTDGPSSPIFAWERAVEHHCGNQPTSGQVSIEIKEPTTRTNTVQTGYRKIPHKLIPTTRTWTQNCLQVLTLNKLTPPHNKSKREYQSINNTKPPYNY